MSTIVTLSERKVRETFRRREAADAILVELARFARERSCRFLIFGSEATGTMTDRSDIDVVIDVDEAREAEVWSFVEDLSRRHAIPVDIHSIRTSKPAFIAHVARTAKVLG